MAGNNSGLKQNVNSSGYG